MKKIRNIIFSILLTLTFLVNFDITSFADTNDGITEDQTTLTFDSSTMMSWRRVYASTAYQGAWTLKDDYVVNTENTDNTSGFFNPSENYADMDISVKIRTDNGDDDWMGIMARVSGAGGTSPTRAYLFWLDRADNGGGIGAHSGLFKLYDQTFSYANMKKLAGTNYKWSRYTWQTLRMVVRTNSDNSVRIMCYINGNLAVDYTDYTNPIYSGSYGFCSYSQADARYKEITGSVTLAKYKIYFDSVGGRFPSTSSWVAEKYPGRTDMMQKTVISTKHYGDTYGDDITIDYDLPKPLKDKMVFTGWYNSLYGGTQITKGSKVQLESDTTLYAHWRETKVTCMDYDLQTGELLGQNTYSGYYSLGDTAKGSDFGDLRSYGYYYSGEKFTGTDTTCIVSETDSANIVRRYFTTFTDKDEMVVKTPDLNAPNVPCDGQLAKAQDYYHASVVWAPQKDNGTTYYHKITSYTEKAFVRMATSKPVETTITTGTKGYLYYADEYPTGLVTKQNSTFTALPKATVDLMNANRTMKKFVYLHVATIDNAGNVSATYDVPYNLANMMLYLYTDKIAISSDKQNYYTKDENTNSYFVQGSTDEAKSVFNLSFNGRVEPSASYFRQANEAIFETTTNTLTDKNDIFTPNTYHAKAWILQDAFGSVDESSNLLKLVDVHATRSEDLVKLNTSQSVYTTLPDNTNIVVTPEARSRNDYGDPFSSRDEQVFDGGRVVDGSLNDKKNKINLTVDSTAPTLLVDEKYEDPSNVVVVDDKLTLSIRYADFVKDVNPKNPQFGSGVKANTERAKVTITQEQTDNGGPESKVIYTESTQNTCVKIKENSAVQGEVQIEIDPVKFNNMSGFIDIDLELKDNVGNIAYKSVRLLVLTLDASIKNVDTLSKANNQVFAGGEQGQVIIETNGFADMLDIKFPEKLEELAATEKSVNGQYDETNKSSSITTDVGRVLSDTYPRDDKGQVTRVLPQLQTKLWGTTNEGGMQYKDAMYQHTYLVHYFYAPLYAPSAIYDVVVTVSKEDPKYPGRVYEVKKAVRLYLGVDAQNNGIDNITTEFSDKIKDN